MKIFQDEFDKNAGIESYDQELDFSYYIENRIKEQNSESVWRSGIFYMFGYTDEEIKNMSYDELQNLLVDFTIAINEYQFKNFGNTPYYLYKGDNKEQYGKFIEYIYTPIFQHSDSPISMMSINKQFDYLLKSIDKGLQVNSNFLHELEYKISFGNVSKIADDIVLLLNDYSEEQQIVLLDMLTSLFGIQNYAEDSKEIFWSRIKLGLMTNNKSVFFQYYGQIIGEWKYIMTKLTKDFKTIIVDNEVKFIDDNGIKKDQFEVIEDTLINIGDQKFENKAFVKAIQSLQTQNFIDIINDDLNIDITQLTLQSQIFFLKYLWSKTPKEFEEFKQILSTIDEKDKINFMTTFLACSKNQVMGEVILELAQYDGSDQIFAAYAQLINLQSEVDSADINSREFLKAIINRGEKLLLESRDSIGKGNNNQIPEKYSAQLVKSGAFVKALISNNEKGRHISIDEFNRLSPNFEVYSLEGGDILKNKPTDGKYTQFEMMIDDSYISPDKFGPKDYEWLVKRLQETYGEDDTRGAKSLIQNIPQDLQNKKSKFYILRDKNTGINSSKQNIRSICQIQELSQNEVYVGTHYVDANYRGEFGFGEYVLELGLSQLPNLDNITGEVTIHNPSLERHINKGNAVATHLNEPDETSETGYFTVKIFLDKNFISKDLQKYSNDKIIELAEENLGEDIQIYKVNTKKGYDSDYIQLCKDMMNQGFGITRFFYDKGKNNEDMHATYLVFEKM